MIYSNEYRLRRRVHPHHQEESPEFALAVAVVFAVAAGFYILASFFYIRPAQLYTLYGLPSAISLTWYIAILGRGQHEGNSPRPPFFVSHDRDRKAVRNAYKQNSIMLRNNFDDESGLRRTLMRLPLSAAGCRKTCSSLSVGGMRTSSSAVLRIVRW